MGFLQLSVAWGKWGGGHQNADMREDLCPVNIDVEA